MFASFSHRAGSIVPVCAAAARSAASGSERRRERQQFAAEVRKAQSLGESADADRHEIGHRKAAADDLRPAGERRNRRHHAGKLRGGQNRQDGGAEQCGDLGAA